MKEYRHKTSWNDDNLTDLCNINNHKIVKNKYGYYKWCHKLDDKWSVQSIIDFEDYKKPASYLHFWLHCWRKELEHRQLIDSRKIAANNRKVKRLKKAFRKTQNEKIIELTRLQPNFNVHDVANELGVNIATVYRALKTA